ncbi:MAG: hypothetical protein PHV06_09170, partial [bacterium]|nr:hypothetical protein [bacterium]
QVLAQEPLKATRGNINKAIDMLEKHRGGGGTNLLAALNTALALPKKEGMSRIVVIATDGYVSIEKKAFDLIREKLGEANFFAFGIGSSVNRYIIEGIARVGKGSPFIVTNKADAEDAAAKFREYIRCPVLTDIKVKFEGFDGYEVEPVAIPDLFAQRTVVLYGKYKNNKGRIILTGNTASGKYERSFSLSDYSENPENIGLQYLWAREKIANISDYNKESEEVKKEVTALGLKYNLMTAYTSFVAVDKVIKETGEVVTVQQPLPLPEGVSNLAVGDQFYTGTFGGTIQTQPGSVNRNSSEENITVECMKLSKTDIKPLETNVQRTVTEVPVTSGHGYYVRGKQTGLWLDELDGKVHASYLADLLKAMEKDIAADLEDWMKKNHLKMLSLTIEFDNGSIKNIKTDKFEGDKFNQSELEKIFKKMSPSMPVTGEIKMTFLIK